MLWPHCNRMGWKIFLYKEQTDDNHTFLPEGFSLVYSVFSLRHVVAGNQGRPPFRRTTRSKMASSTAGKHRLPYIDTLDSRAKARYIEKLSVIDELDPYTIPSSKYSADPDLLPPVTYPDIYNYRGERPQPIYVRRPEMLQGTRRIQPVCEWMGARRGGYNHQWSPCCEWTGKIINGCHYLFVMKLMGGGGIC